MVVNYDDKGKIFTNVVTKKAVPAIIQTLTHRIQGLVHIREGERLKDELTNSDTFLAVTDAIIFNARGTQLYQSDFLAVNRDHVVWIIPEAELADAVDAGGDL